jgi:hypothetical protein
MKDIKALFDRAEESGESLEFQRVRIKLSPRRDLHALMLLDLLVPSSAPIISVVHDDEIYLTADVDTLAQSSITDEQVVDLARCGVRCQGSTLRMYAV